MANSSIPPISAADYSVACICPMGIELAPVEAMLDEKHENLPLSRDCNAYTLGRLGGHCVVIAVMPTTGNNAAATVATQLLNDFLNIRFVFLVGIGGGVPGTADIRLGDVAVSSTTDSSGGVIQYDLGKRLDGDQFQRTGSLNRPPPVLSAYVQKLASQHLRKGHQLQTIHSEMLTQHPYMKDKYDRPTELKDNLFQSSYSHPLNATSCDGCDPGAVVVRSSRPSVSPYIHYGTIGSANIVVKDAGLREKLQSDMGLICVEMEASGLMDSFPCLVIRGICDYADSHKNKKWQPYAAAMAAAYMKELLLSIPVREVTQGQDRSWNCVTAPLNKHFEVPQLLSSVFTGHDDICTHLDMSLGLGPVSHQSTQRRFVLHGLGGAGKTQITLHYLQTHREKYWAIFWIDASTVDSIQQSFHRIARLLELETEIDLVKRYLANTTNSWLLVFDNADDPQLSLTAYFPAGNRGDVIITSRNPGRRQYHTVGYHEVGPLTVNDAQILFSKTIYDVAEPPDEVAKCGILDVVATLGYLALAITQAGAYIRETLCTFDDYLELYRRQRQQLLAYESQMNSTSYKHTVYTTWQVSLGLIESMQETRSICALRILRLICFYHHGGIPIEMFERAWQTFQKHDQSVEDLLVWPEPITDSLELRRLIQTSTALLASFSLIKIDANVSISLHPLVRDWFQLQLSEAERGPSCRSAIRFLVASVRQDSYHGDAKYESLLLPHIHASIRSYSSICGEIDADDGTSQWTTIVDILSRHEFTQDAIVLQEQIVRVQKCMLAADDHEMLLSMTSLADNYIRVGRPAEAKRLLEPVVKCYRDRFGANFFLTVPSTHSLLAMMGASYTETGCHREAQELWEQVFSACQTMLNIENPRIINTVRLLCLASYKLGHDHKSVKWYEILVRLYKAKFGVNHHATMDSMIMLASRYRLFGQPHRALDLSKQVVQYHKDNAGVIHPKTLWLMHELALGYAKIGQLQEALKLMEQVVHSYKTICGTDFQSTLPSMRDLAIMYLHTGRRHEAVELMEQVVLLYSNKFGPDHPRSVASQECLLRMLQDQPDQHTS